jgi:hypothetical protein
MSKVYYSLLVQDHNDHLHPWVIAFGDYDRLVVEDEAEEYQYQHRFDDHHTKIIATSDDQPTINARVAALNSSLDPWPVDPALSGRTRDDMLRDATHDAPSHKVGLRRPNTSFLPTWTEEDEALAKLIGGTD